MSEVLSNIGQFLGSGTGKNVLGGGLAGAGFLQNLLAQRQAQQKQKFVQDLITNPAKFNALVTGAEQPLSKGLTTDIARQTDAYGAERGLGSSPAIMKDVYAQALAPYQEQQQQMAINSVLQRLGIYADTPTMKPVDITSVLKLLSSGGGGGGATANPTAGIDLSSVSDPTAGLVSSLAGAALPTSTIGDPTPTNFFGGDF